MAPRALFWVGLALLIPVGGYALQWYEYYERGVTAARAGKCEQAIPDLLAALREQGEPRLRIRTYGTNFLVRYDPYLYLAECSALLGDLAAAEKYLRVSKAAGVSDSRDLAKVAELVAKQREAAEAMSKTGRPSPPMPGPTSPGPPSVAVVRVTSEPEGCSVLLDGVFVGRTPWGPAPVKLGSHRLRVETEGFYPREETVTVGPEGANFYFTLAPKPTPKEAKGEPAVPIGEISKAEPRPGARGERMADNTPTPSIKLGVTPVIPTATPYPEASPQPEAGALVAADGREKPVLAWWLTALALVVGLLTFAIGAGIKVRKQKAAKRFSQIQKTVRLGGEVFAGKYAIVGVVGAGGMGTTFEAVRLADNLSVAIKIPHDHLLPDKESMERFLREAKLGAQLHHPRIVTIYEAGEHEGKPFFVMELLKGETLKARLKRESILPLATALRVAREVAEALDYAHSKGVIHRDLKPENVMLLADGGLKVMDFGLARVLQDPRITRTSVFVGTPMYAAPELLQDPEHVDGRADLYSLGIVLFEMLEGRPPFAASSVIQVLEKHVAAPFPGPRELPRPLPPDVYELLRRCCAKKPDDRWPTAEALLVHLDRILLNLPEAGGTSDPFAV